MLAAGDVADCGGGALATAALIAPQAGVVAGLGDMACPDGSADAFARCYEPAWGRSATGRDPRPATTTPRHPALPGYHEYFADVAGPAPQGYGGADVVLNGHDHDYRRFTPQTPDGATSPEGIREFVVGTGGTDLRPFAGDRPTVEYRRDDHLGVLRLDLDACGYRWAFLPVGGGAPLDEGAALGTC